MTKVPPHLLDTGRGLDAREGGIMASLGSDEAKAIADLDNINAVDPDAHQTADAIILALMSPEVREAYERAVERCSWWKEIW